ncbi:subtilisin-like protein [Cenococcum geophilum 1.58]|uniref:subtilisin-like protein n=1 Tax=Cenococcum geophilum 1.58 TaxID=794803 RepID=UPI00358F4E57|nr:subtilisin-like protein [Cenococcum geophilum 1.58]
MNCEVGDSQYKRVRIAILDTGIAGPPVQRPPKLVTSNWGHLVECKSFEHSGVWNKDSNGHGTHTSMLLLKVCPNAEVSILKVVERHGDSIDQKAVSDAIVYAVEKGADIISISLGWKYDNGHLKTALLYAQEKHVLVFAATSNDGIRDSSGMMYPARAHNVISVDSANGEGETSGFNPASNDNENSKGDRFTAPGEDVLSAYPPDLEKSGIKRMTGTSFSTPIAAGVAALVLEFSRQPPLGLDPNINFKLRDMDVMRSILHTFCSEKKEGSRGFRFLYPWLNLSSGDHASRPYGGDANDLGSPRFDVAGAFVRHLRKRVDPNIGTAMYNRLFSSDTDKLNNF